MILGITGGSGCGKTTLLRRAGARGGEMIDCDEVYHRLLLEDADLLAALEKRFPGAVEEGALNRKKLGKVVFDDPKALAGLGAITHPRVVAEVKRILDRAREKPLAAIDAVGLIESGLGALCDVTVAVTAPVELRVRRLMAREGIGEDYARLRITAQKSCDAFSAQCGETLCNDCPTAEEFAARCDQFLTKVLGG